MRTQSRIRGHGRFRRQEPNQGSDPLDWRSMAITSPDYLTTVYPNGVSWDGAFDPSYTP